MAVVSIVCKCLYISEPCGAAHPHKYSAYYLCCIIMCEAAVCRPPSFTV